MDAYQALLFGQAPRRVGTPNQHWVYHPDQVAYFIDRVNGEYNAYATVGWWDFDEDAAISDKVLYDLDSPAKAGNAEVGDWSIYHGPVAEEPPADEVIEEMRANPALAEEILGPVCEDARRLARRSRNDNVPLVGVYSGFGIHIHQLFEPTLHPDTAMESTALRYEAECDLETADDLEGEPDRLCRIPNCQRVAEDRPCNLYTVPLTGAELASVEPEWLLDVSHSPRTEPAPDVADRPEMHVWDDYQPSTPVEIAPGEAAEPRPLNPAEGVDDDDLRWFMENLLGMPCMVSYLLDDPNPDHMIRVNATTMLFNSGLTPQTVVKLYRAINWVDWDAAETRKQVNHIYQNGYSDMSCRRLRAEGYCAHDEEPEDCPTYGWQGGTLRYR